MKRVANSQRGTTLVIALVMLMMITLFVVTMVRLTNTNSAIVANMQAQKNVEAEAEQAADVAVNQFNFFSDAVGSQNGWAGTTASMSYQTLWATYTPTGGTGTAPPALQSAVTISRPQCMLSTIATGYSALSGIAPQDTYWDIAITAKQSVSGAEAEMHQGVRIRLPAGNCP